MKIDKNVLVMSLFPKKVISHFDDTFNTFKLYEQNDINKYLTHISDKIDAIAVMGPSRNDLFNSIFRDFVGFLE